MMKNKSKEKKEIRFIIQQILFGAHFFTNRHNLPSLGSQKNGWVLKRLYLQDI